MAMGPTISAATVLAGANALLLGALAVVWLRNYRTFGTGLVAGLAIFALVTLAENLLAVYYFLSMQSFYAGDPHVQQAVLVLRVLQFVAFSILAYVTLR